MIDLAFTPKESSGELATPVQPASPSKPRYPSLRLNGEQAEKAKLNKCAIGDVYEIKLRVKAKRLGGEDYEMEGSDKPPAEFDVISAEEATEVSGESEETEKPERPKRRILTPRDLKGGKAAYAE